MSKTFANLNKKKNDYKGIDSLVNVKAKEVMANIMKGKVTKEDFLALKILKEMPQIIKDQPYVIFALNYDCNSLVGLVTDLCTNVATALPTEFFNEDGSLNFKKFSSAFKVANKNGKVDHYESIFVEDINVIEFELNMCKQLKVKSKYVSNKEMKEFKRRLSNLNPETLTVVDIIKIQKDLWVLFRAWQESSIDCTKDKDKKYAVDFSEIIGAIKIRKISFSSISINEYQIKYAKYNDSENIPQLEISFNDADEENDEFIETVLTNAQHDIRCAIEPTLRKIAGIAVEANNSPYEDYVYYVKEHAELALTIQRVFSLILDLRKEKGLRLTKEDYMMLRAVIVKDAEDLGIENKMDYVRVAFGVAGVNLYVNKDNEIVVSEFSSKEFSRRVFMVEKLFGNMAVLEKALLFDARELVHEDESLKMEIEVLHVFDDVENGLYNFVNGAAYDANGNILFDSTSEFSGKVSVEDSGVYFLYNPCTEIEDIPEIDSIFVEARKLIADEDKSERGKELYDLLSSNDSYTVENCMLILSDEEGSFEVAELEDIYDIDTTREINKFYGTVGYVLNGEKPIPRKNNFLILSYNREAMAEYITRVTAFAK